MIRPYVGLIVPKPDVKHLSTFAAGSGLKEMVGSKVPSGRLRVPRALPGSQEAPPGEGLGSWGLVVRKVEVCGAGVHLHSLTHSLTLEIGARAQPRPTQSRVLGTPLSGDSWCLPLGSPRASWRDGPDARGGLGVDQKNCTGLWEGGGLTPGPGLRGRLSQAVR